MNVPTCCSSMNITKICRICLLESENMRSVFSKLDQTEILEPEVIYLSDVLKRITTIPVRPASF